MLHAYPPQLAGFVRSRWGEDQAALPAERGLEALLSVAYQASLLRDEDRPVTFRLLLASPDALAQDTGPPTGLHVLPFATPRAFDEHELRRLSQAAKYHRTVIGVGMPSGGGGFTIWGIIQTGPRWLPSARAGVRDVPSLPGGALVVRVPAPGRIEVAKGDVTIAELRGGLVTEPGMDVFESRWLPARFADMRDEVVAIHQASFASGSPPAARVDSEVVRLIGQDVVRRTVALMREGRHGGTLVMLSPDADEAHAPFLDVKYPLRSGTARRRYRTVMLALLRARALEQHESDPNLAHANEAIFELSQLMAAFTEVDGAVILTRRFEILGFGAEIVGALPQVPRVARALDLEGVTRSHESTDGVGTRHRSVYRLVAAVPDALGIVVSQDGTVRIVASVDGDVTYWDHSATGEIG